MAVHEDIITDFYASENVSSLLIVFFFERTVTNRVVQRRNQVHALERVLLNPCQFDRQTDALEACAPGKSSDVDDSPITALENNASKTCLTTEGALINRAREDDLCNLVLLECIQNIHMDKDAAPNDAWIAA